MIKKILAFVLSLLLAGVFYVYALLREDETTKQSDRWVVSEEQKTFGAIGNQSSQNPQDIARYMEAAAPLPGSLDTGTVQDGSYHGYRVRLMHITAPNLVVRGVRPLSAYPMVRTQGLSYRPSGAALLGYPLIIAQDSTGFYYYFTTEDAAFEIHTTAADEKASLAVLGGLQLIKP